MTRLTHCLTLARTFARPACIFAALLLGSAPVLFATDQAPTGPGSQAADEAYHELAAKNYQGAIQNFQKALAQDPSNSHWREDLAYADLAAGSLTDAKNEFERVYR